MSLVEFIPRTDNFSVAPFFLQLRLLFDRNITFIKREPLVLVARVAIAIVQGLFALSVFWQIDGPTLSDEQSMVGSMFYLSANVFVGIIYGTIATFQIERSVLLRELASRSYGLAAYFTVKNLIEIPIMIMFPLLTELVVFWGAPYTNRTNEFWAFYLPLFLIS